MASADACLMYQQTHDRKPSPKTIGDVKYIDDIFHKAVKVLNDTCQIDIMTARSRSLVQCGTDTPEAIAIQWDQVLTGLGLPFKKREALSWNLYLAAVPNHALLGMPQRDYIASLFAAVDSLEKCH